MISIRVLIVDDHLVVRAGTRALLEAADGIDVVGEARDGREAVTQAELLRPDVILMDLVMPEMDGVEAIRTILERQGDIRIVVLTGSSVDEKILEALRAGALGYLPKEAGTDDFLHIIRHVHRGEPSLPLAITRKLLQPADPGAGSASKTELLTEREIEVLRLVAKGLSNQRIGDQMHLSTATVRTHMSNILSKLELSNRVEATLWALAEGLTTLEDCRNP